jgi:D-glycero-alpha-D-manno-heptose 1-phosphate guanylyltransferase
MIYPQEVLILAGGLGTRLRSVVRDVPKPMAPIAGRPFLEYLLDYWRSVNATRFVLSVGYLAECIKEHFGESYRGVPIDYVVETSPLGTGGAIRQALTSIGFGSSDIWVVNGDTWFEIDTVQMVNDYVRSQQTIGVALKPMASNERYGSVTVDRDMKVVTFGQGGGGPTLINAGTYLMRCPDMGELLRQFQGRFSFESEFLSHYANTGGVAASIQDRMFLDIGVPEDFRRAQQLLPGRLQS